MLSNKKRGVIRFLNFLLFALCILLYGNAAFDMSIKNAYPFIMLALLVAFSVFSKISHAAIAGFICGAFADSIAANSYCFNTAALMCLTVGACLLSDNVFNKNLKAVITLCFLTVFCYYLLYWIFFIIPVLSTGKVEYLLRFALPSAVYTTVFVIPFYFIYKYWYKLKTE